jgi:hypothetical protein
MDYMEYKVIIQENMGNGNIFMHTFPLESAYVQEALKFRDANYHSDCVFVLEYCQN